MVGFVTKRIVYIVVRCDGSHGWIRIKGCRRKESGTAESEEM